MVGNDREPPVARTDTIGCSLLCSDCGAMAVLAELFWL
jgi:hypothetical protein